MAETQEYEMGNGEDFSQDVSTQGELNGSSDQNGSGDAQPADSGSAEAPGRDDDRYVIKNPLKFIIYQYKQRDTFGGQRVRVSIFFHLLS